MVGFEEPVALVIDRWTGTRGSANVVDVATLQLDYQELEFRAEVMDWAEARGISDDQAVRYLRRLIQAYDQRQKEIATRH